MQEVMQQCYGLNHFSITSTPRRYSQKTLKVWKKRERKRLSAEGKSRSEINKRIREFEEEEKKRWRCEQCQQIIENQRQKQIQKRINKDKEKREKKKLEKRRIAEIEKKLNYICEKFEENKTLPDLDKVEIVSQINEIKQSLQPVRIREEQKKEGEKELAKKIDSFLAENLAGKHYLKLTEKQREKIKEVKSIPQFDIITGDIIKVHNEIKKGVEDNIYSTKTWKHQVGWPAFLVSLAVATKKIRKIIKKKPKPAASLKEEVQEKFNLWRLNMILSVAGYAVSFFLVKGLIDKWVRPNIGWCLENHEDTTILVVTGILGGLFLVDSYISSELKTPLQRLAIKIESANISEKEKKELLSITQRSNETFKETLKRFGLLTIAGTLIKLLGKSFDEKIIANFCYFIPIAFGGWQIWEISKKIKKSNWE